jgi:hypothetical protein
MNTNKLLVFLLLLFCATSGFALTYRSDLNNGSWSDYNSGLSAEYYQADLTQATYNRDFETNFDLNGVSCQANWCFSDTHANTFKRSSGYVFKGSYSGFWNVPNDNDPSGSALLFGQTENLIGAGFSFSYSGSDPNYSPNDDTKYGYVNDSNSFVSLGLIPYLSTGWANISGVMPSSNSRFAINFKHINGTGYTFYIDDLNVIRNNVGTFYKGATAPSCASIQGCSNINSASLLGSNATRDLYWIVDYVPSASCSVRENGGLIRAMSEISGGMYYYKINSVAYPAADVNVTLQASCAKSGFNSKGFYANADIFNDANIATTLVTGNTATGNNAIRGDLVTFWSKYYDDLGTLITDGTCTLTQGGQTLSMAYNSSTGRYETQIGYISDGAYSTTHTCTKGNYQTATSNYTLNVNASATQSLTITPIANIFSYSLSDTNNFVNLTIADNSDIIFSALNSDSSYIFGTFWSNADATGKQYFIYTSSDGVNWVFSDTLTFGATNSTPIQKIWNGTSYDYSFTASLSQGVKTYFKLVYQNPAKFWETIKTSSDWINVNNPSAFTTNSKNFDVFSDSNYTNIQSYTAQSYQNLTSSTLTTGYELQFTAYADSPGTLRVGSRVNGVDGAIQDVSVTTTATRFSVPINPGSRDAALVIDSNNISNNTFYLTDYALIPRAYFYGQLEIKNRDNTILPAILRDGNYYHYIKEGVGFNVLTNFYDTNGDLETLRVDTLLGGTIVKTQQFGLTSSAGTNQAFNQTMDGVIDLNGIAGSLNQLDPLRDVTIVATLINSSGQSVAQQFKTIKLLQFPYFASDLSMYFDTSNKKVGMSPNLTFKFNVQDPATLIGFEFNIYDANHSVSSPNYTKTILLSDFGCSTNFNCAKQLTFDDYKWEAEAKYTIKIIALLKTENKNYTDFLATKSQVVEITYSSYEMMRILQAYERRDATIQYTNIEPIPLILQVRDDKGTDLFNTLKPYMKLYSITGFARTDYSSAWLPKSHAYDPITGINYWFWNNIFTKDDGTLFSDGDQVGFQALWVDNTQSHQSISAHPAQLSRRCSIGGYGGFFDNSQLGYVGTLIGTFLTDDYGCSAGYEAGAIVTDIAGTPEVIDINTSYVPKSGVLSTLFCKSGINSDTNTYNSIDTGVSCLVLYKKSEEAIDGFNIKIANKNSDLAQTDSSTKQYIEFFVSQEEIWLNDIEQLRQTMNTNYDTQNIHTWGDFFRGLMQGETTKAEFESMDFLTGAGFIKGAGIDYNLDGAFDPTLIDGAFVFTINPKLINLSDYSVSNPEILDLNPKTFRNYALIKKINVPVNNCSLKVGISEASDPIFRTSSLPSPLVAYIPYQTAKDANGTLRVISATTTFNIIADMYSANETKFNRSAVQVTLSVTPTKPASNDIISLLKDNWFWIFMGFVVLILITFIVVPWIIALKSGR